MNVSLSTLDKIEAVSRKCIIMEKQKHILILNLTPRDELC